MGLLLEIAGNETALMRVTITVQASVANKSLQDMTLCKFNQRLQLSFSETRADTCLSVRLAEDLWDSERGLA